ncbi:heterokaryon incompatibility protein-domain-containing protein [Phaeosphaeriaceae sp. PMI808]|nr:heterokaryon incompatibility protein-domain-containing protein [Phaeosphaeriaceae sp. PMI808]
MAYSHSKLSNPHSIRLLHILPGPASTPLKVHLAPCQLDNATSYEALSYVWGEPDTTATLAVGDHQLHISTNLHTIILHLRHHDRIRTVWIDAICINQQDSKEKSLQVAIMGQIFEKADTVLCWLGGASEHCVTATTYLQQLADRHSMYIQEDAVEHIWAITWDNLVAGVDVDAVVQSAIAAHVECVYDSPWFTRLWIVQEVSFARDPVILIGECELRWKAFELATRVLARCLKGMVRQPGVLVAANHAWSLIHAREQHVLNMRSGKQRPVALQLDQAWCLGSVAWHMRHNNCSDDRDRVYALLGLTARGNSLGSYVPKPFMPDYTRSAEWAYAEFWARYGGYTSLFNAGFARRGTRPPVDRGPEEDGAGLFFTENRLPSWCPDVRPQANKWKPVFSADYAASTPLHHMESHIHRGKDPGPVLIRGHRFDTIEYAFNILQLPEARKEPDGVPHLQRVMVFLVSLGLKYDSYPSGQDWVEALGFALMTGMPSGPNESDHPFQSYLKKRDMGSRLDNSELLRIWKVYLNEVITKQIGKKSDDLEAKEEHGDEWKVAVLLHEYLGDVLKSHCFIVTKRGYMGLGPPDSVAGDVVVVLGGPGTPFTVRDTSILLYGELEVGKYSKETMQPIDGQHTRVVESETGTAISHLLGPCYVQGIMGGELYGEERYKEELEWETDRLGTVPKPTICLV